MNSGCAHRPTCPRSLAVSGAPRRWLPAQRPETLRTRASVIVGRLEREGRISGAQAREAQAELSLFFGVSPAPGYVAEAGTAMPAGS
ncbi:hypothetical protein [Corallococcus exercitus]|uniref:hypothetical protein n=1 Tax=Corallococcus exercitus TaxID=2316736 RepID=UPI001FC9B431|nr:hypothetical protein [Corallococcus exercitus]